jgi:hypothetical protein
MARYVAVAATLLLQGCDWLQPKRFAAEVGYYEAGQLRWDIFGDFASLEECQSNAVARFNHYHAEKRAHSWSCLLKNGKGGYTSRHR